MNEKWVVALDQGTSSCRAFAVDARGVVRAQKSKLFSPTRPSKGLSFYEANSLLQAQLEVLHALLDEIGPKKAAALAVCSQRSTIVLWDKNTGQPLAPVLTWEDGRSLAESEAAPLSQAEIHAQTGLFKTPYFSAPKIAWCLKNFPAAKAAAQAGNLLAAPVASYFIWNLTGGRVFATDPTLAQRTLLWNIQTSAWSETLCQTFGVPMTCLPAIYPTTADYGSYLYKGVEIPICVCVADQQAAAVYYALDAGKTVVNYGTGAFVLHHTGEQLRVLPGMLSSVAAGDSVAQRQFLLEGPIFSAGSVLQWLRTKGIVVDPAQVDTLATSAKNPVLLLPALGGLGAPYWDYRTKVTVQNVDSQTQSADWVAGVLRSIACRVADVIYYLRTQGYPVEDISVAGGLSNSAYLLQTQADVLGTPLTKQLETESTVLGAIRLAADYLKWNTAGWNAQLLPSVTPKLSPLDSRHMYQAWQHFVQSCRS